MSVFSLRDRKVVLNTNVMQVPELKAIVDAFPDCYMNVLSFVNYMTNPIKEENPYLEVRPTEKVGKLLRDFPGNYDEETPVVKAAMNRMVQDFVDLPEDRMYEAAKIAAENMETALRNIKVTSLADIKTLSDIFPKLEKAMEALGKTREARSAARSAVKSRGDTKTAYDEE